MLIMQLLGPRSGAPKAKIIVFRRTNAVGCVKLDDKLEADTYRSLLVNLPSILSYDGKVGQSNRQFSCEKDHFVGQSEKKHDEQRRAGKRWSFWGWLLFGAERLFVWRCRQFPLAVRRLLAIFCGKFSFFELRPVTVESLPPGQ
jgi:hypothetical protein